MPVSAISSGVNPQSMTQPSPVHRGTDFQALASALQSGDVASAQRAFATLLQEVQKTRGAQKPHHHHHAAPVSPATTAALAAVPGAKGAGSIIDILA